MTIDLIVTTEVARGNSAARSTQPITGFLRMDRSRMNNVPYSQAQMLLIKAAEDEVALQVDGNPESVVGFHAQQAVEKLIKALLSALSVPLELTHNTR